MKFVAASQLGLFSEILNWLTLWDLRWIPVAEATLVAQMQTIRRAVDALGGLEALSMLSLPLSEQPDYELPTPLESGAPIFEAMEIGHPLIEPGHAVRNLVSLGTEANLWIVTGSNMAGKSTYLKSLGLGYVLACAGGPVCAKGLRFTPMALFTDVNVRDSLDDGKSYFRAEVERVHAAIQAARASPFVFTLFDELFRGTNSRERSALSRAVLRDLAAHGALVLVTTHDVALTSLASADSGWRNDVRVQNWHFQETVANGALSFDYRLRPDAATTRNAIRVLEDAGYPLEITRLARQLADGA
jgi:DNA mismatch repair ATPase MutS